MAKPQTIEEYKKVTGRRFRRTKDQMARRLTPEKAFQEWLANGSMPSKPEEKAQRPDDIPRIRRTNDEIQRGLTIEDAYKERKDKGTLNRRQESLTREVCAHLCGVNDRNCELPRRDADYKNIPNQCIGFQIIKDRDGDGIDVIINCRCDCHHTAFEINKFGHIKPQYIKAETS